MTHREPHSLYKQEMLAEAGDVSRQPAGLIAGQTARLLSSVDAATFVSLESPAGLDLFREVAAQSHSGFQMYTQGTHWVTEID